MKNIVPVPVTCSEAGLLFPTPGRGGDQIRLIIIFPKCLSWVLVGVYQS